MLSANKILTRKISVQSMDGHIRDATLMVCPNCESEQFLVFAIEGRKGKHLHLQCSNCSQSYCRGGQECDA